MDSANSALLSILIPWFGTDGIAENAALTNSTMGPIVSQVRLPSTLFNFVNNSKTVDFYNTIKGYPSGWSYPWRWCLLHLCGLRRRMACGAWALSAGIYDGKAIHDILPTVAANFYGLTGWEGLQPSGDRIPESYQIWKVESSGSSYSWVLAGTWEYNTDTVTWINSPSLGKPGFGLNSHLP